MAVAIKKHRFTVDEFMRLDARGVLGPPDMRIELVDGDIIEMPPTNPPHASVVDRLTRLFFKRLDGRAIVRVQGPVRLDNHSMPLPDILLLAPRADYYAKDHPDPQTVFLAVEVADTSLRYDREIKAPLYAKKGIREFWVVDVNARCVYVYTVPHPDRYAMNVVAQEDSTLTLAAFPEESFEFRDIFG